MLRTLFLFPLLLLAACYHVTLKHPTGLSHAREVAAHALLDLGPCINPRSIHVHQISAEELVSYLHQGEPAEDGYLVTYVCEVDERHLDVFAAFVNRADKVSLFVPSTNLEQFARRYGVDYQKKR